MGSIEQDKAKDSGRIELAHSPSFRLGLLGVEPATRELVAATARETIEPRVMQVLVALARAQGRVVTRDELTRWCWDGRIVGEDAINRVIGRIRQLGQGIGQSSFALETITKVGYRLTVSEGKGFALDAPPPFALPARPAVDRRTFVALGAAGAAGAGLLAWRPWRHRPPAEARELMRLADIAWKAGLDHQARQAVFHLERAVQIDPQYADAWGALAVAYTHFLEGYGEAEMASIPGRIRAAAARALALDVGNADAPLALACILPNYRHWARVETDLRRLSDAHPRLWLAHGRLAFTLYQVGRFEEGVRLHRRVLEIDPMIALPYVAIARALSNLGRVQEAGWVLDQARGHWPAHPMLWNARYFHLLFNGMPQAAIAFVMDPDTLPSGIGPELVDKRIALARAVERRRPADVEAVIADHRAAASADINAAPFVAPIFALLGRFDLAFACLDRYYFDRGPFGTATPIGPYTRRHTDLLFTPPFAGVRDDSRFTALLRAVGLEGYWAASGVRPDYRSAV